MILIATLFLKEFKRDTKDTCNITRDITATKGNVSFTSWLIDLKEN
jgi:hypothetical protein